MRLCKKFGGVYIVDENSSDYDLIINTAFRNNKIYDQVTPKIFILSEVVRPKPDGQEGLEIIKVNPDEFDLTVGFDYIDHPKYLRIPLYYIFYKDQISTDFHRGTCDPSKKQFACFMVSNSGWNEYNDGCKLRNRIFHKLSLYKTVASGGRYLNTTNGPIPSGDKEKEWISNCKFFINYENQTYPGYNTEKVAQSYIQGAIPIYYSHPEGLKDINKKAIIYAGDFESEDQLVEYIKTVDNDDELYCKIWNEKLINDKSKNYSVLKENLKDKIRSIMNNRSNKK